MCSLYGIGIEIALCILQVAIDSAAPVNEAGGSGGLMIDSPEPYGSYGPMRTYGGMYGSLDFDDVSVINYFLKQL